MIKVKKLPWVENKSTGGYYTPITKKYYIHKSIDKFSIEVDAEIFRKLCTLEEAQNILQMYWDEYVLSLVEE